MTEIGETQPRFISGLGEALFRGDSERIATLLSGVQSGEIIKTWGLLLLVDNPTQKELALLTKSKQDRREYGLFETENTIRELEGKTAEIDEEKVLRIASELSKGTGQKSFTHTHWDKESIPVPSGPDIGIFRQLSEQWGYRCRVVSWLPEGKTFEFLGEYPVK